MPNFKVKITNMLFKKPSLYPLGLGVMYSAWSLTPSLLPRVWMFQGVVTGFSFISGYATGCVVLWAWKILELPVPSKRWTRILSVSFLIVASILFIYFLAKTGTWQNRLRDLVAMQPTSSTSPIKILTLSVMVAYVLLIMIRFVLGFNRVLVRLLDKKIPRRVSLGIGVLVSTWFFATIVTGTFSSYGLKFANNSFSLADKGTADGVSMPVSDLRSGSSRSLVDWDDLGYYGRSFVATGPSKENLINSNVAAQQPIRVYIGLASANSYDERSKLALQELIRTKAFERKILVIATSTGRGWLDPRSIDSLEYMHSGNTAIVSTQYSYLPSWISLLADQRSAKDSSISLFNAVHEYWQDLNETTRPELYLYGLSLGAYGSEAAASRVSLANNPIDGALWAGPPFVSDFWQQVTKSRDEGSPYHQPVFQKGRVIRFAGTTGALQKPTAEWEDNKFIYLQYPTDPVVFFSPSSYYRRPEWLGDDRADAVTPDMNWRWGITFWQLLLDVPSANYTPDGYGHKYSVDSYIESWAALTEPSGWSPDQATELKARVLRTLEL